RQRKHESAGHPDQHRGAVRLLSSREPLEQGGRHAGEQQRAEGYGERAHEQHRVRGERDEIRDPDRRQVEDQRQHRRQKAVEDAEKREPQEYVARAHGAAVPESCGAIPAARKAISSATRSTPSQNAPTSGSRKGLTKRGVT